MNQDIKERPILFNAAMVRALLDGKLLDLRHADCMDLMREYPDKHFDLAIVDPPYGIGIDKDFSASSGQLKGGKTGFCQAARTTFKKTNWDSSAADKSYFKELVRVSKNQIVWGANHFCEKLVTSSSPCWIVWNKNTNGYFADCELAYTSFKTAVRKFDFTWNGLLQGDMANKEKRIHPTQKPVKLYDWLLANYAKPGQKILDTHLGSGSHAIAAHYAKVHLTACEIDADYYQASLERIERETRQMDFYTSVMSQEVAL